MTINDQKPPDSKALIPISEPAYLASCTKCRATISSKKTGCTFCQQDHVNKDALARPGAVVASHQSSTGTPFQRLKLLADCNGYSLARSDSDFMRVAVVTPYELFQGFAWPWSIYPNIMQAFRALKYPGQGGEL